MSTPMLPVGHEEFETLAVAWAFAALEPDEQARFELHCAEGCASCTGQVAAALAVGLELAYAVPDEDPPAALRDRVLAAAAVPVAPGARRIATTDQTAGRGPADATPSRTAGHETADAAPDEVAVRRLRSVGGAGGGRHGIPRRGPTRRLVAALAAAALVGVSAVSTWQIVGRDGGSYAPASRVAALSAQVGDRSVATVVLADGRADVVTDALPPNTGRGTRYVLWGVPAGNDRAPKALGSFVVTSADLHSYSVRLSAPAAGYPVLAVSEEPTGTLPASPSKVLARGALNP